MLMAFLLSLMMVASSPHVLTIPLEMMPDPIEVQKEEWINNLQLCENINKVPWIFDTNGKKSYADFMFQMDTWISYGKKFGATRNNISSSTLQRQVVRSMLDSGGWRNWYNCGKMLNKTIGKYGEDM